MALSIEEIRDSGLLELYVLGEASTDEQSIVRAALVNHKELVKDVEEIEYSLYTYAKIHAVAPSASVKEKLLQQISNSKKPPAGGQGPASSSAAKPKGDRRSFLAPFIISLLAGLGVLGYFLNQSSNQRHTIEDLTQVSVACDSIQQIQREKDAIFAAISSPGSKVFPVNATENFTDTDLYIHSNAQTRRNYIQLLGLPALAENQSYQLWSLRDGEDPMPLDVFQGDEEPIFEVEYVDNTNAYAITIEVLGGVESPTMERLIGVIPVS